MWIDSCLLKGFGGRKRIKKENKVETAAQHYTQNGSLKGTGLKESNTESLVQKVFPESGYLSVNILCMLEVHASLESSSW